jgi:hypothetical protein
MMPGVRASPEAYVEIISTRMTAEGYSVRFTNLKDMLIDI